MLLTITTTRRPANDLGYLLHKHPERFQSFDMSFGKVYCTRLVMAQLPIVLGVPKL